MWGAPVSPKETAPTVLEIPPAMTLSPPGRRPSTLLTARFSGLWEDFDPELVKRVAPHAENQDAPLGLSDPDAAAEAVWPVFGGFKDALEVALRNKRALKRRAAGRYFVVAPNSDFRMCWDIVMLVFLTYVAVFTPYQIAFLSEHHIITTPQSWMGLFVLDRMVDFVFLVDMCVNFRSAWYEGEGRVVVFDSKEAAQKYLKGWFLLDFLSLVPWEMVSLIFDLEDATALRFPKLLKLLRLMKILKVVRASRVVARVEQHLGLKYGVVRLLKFTAGLVILAHWLACGLMFISILDDAGASDVEECFAATDGDYEETNKWRYGIYCGCLCSPGQLYMASIYW